MEPKRIDQLKRMNKDAGRYFFSKNTMRFFRSIVYDNVRAGRTGWYFITSECAGDHHPRLFTARKMDEWGHVSNASEFQEFICKADALDFIIEAAREDV